MKIGQSQWNFQQSGHVPSLTMRRTKAAMGFANTLAHALRTLAGSKSGPVATALFKDDNSFRTHLERTRQKSARSVYFDGLSGRGPSTGTGSFALFAQHEDKQAAALSIGDLCQPWRSRRGGTPFKAVLSPVAARRNTLHTA